MKIGSLIAFALVPSSLFPAAAYCAQEAAPAVLAPADVAMRADGMEVRRGPLLVRVTALTDQIIRVRIGRDGRLPEDASWAVLSSMRAGRVRITPVPDGFVTDALRVTLEPATLKLRVTDRSGKPIVADAD